MIQKKQKIYMIPGTMCNELMWSFMLPSLTENFDIMYLPSPTGQSLDEMLSQITSVLTDESVNVVGFSLGGYLASMLAIKYPQRVNKLFIIANSSGVLPDSEILQRQEAIKFVNKHGYGGMSRRKAASLIDTAHPNTDKIIAIIRQMDKDLGKNVFLDQMYATTHRPDLHQAFYRLQIPTTFYYSKNDRLVDQVWIDQCAADNPCFDEIIEPGSGHMLPLEQPDKLLSHLTNWLDP